MHPTRVPDPDCVAEIIRDVAETQILPHFRKLSPGDIHEKTGPRDLVTIADMEAEAALTRRLGALVPSALIVGEEAAAAHPAITDGIAEAEATWIIDPVDGTLNFSEGRETFAVIVAYVRNGTTMAGWIHAPVSGVTVMAARGQGAWCGGRRLSVAPAAALSAMGGALYVSRARAPAIYDHVKSARQCLGHLSHARCVGHEYLALAQADSHFALFTRLLPWDHAAGALIHAEAGGHQALLDGGAYGPTTRRGSLLLAPDEASWRALKACFLGEDDGAGR